MPRSTIRSNTQEKNATQNAYKTMQKQRTATSNRTGAGTSSAHTSSGHKVIEKIRPRILDENNQDVTPKPLFDNEASKTRHGSALFQSIEGNSTPTEVMSNGSILNTNAILTGVNQSFGVFPESSTHVSSESNQHPTDSIQEVHYEKERDQSALFLTNIETMTKKEDKTYARIGLNETGTFCLLDILSTCISDEDPTCESIKQKNEKYIELKKTKAGNDSYAERGINTFNNPPKVKTTQTDRITISERGVWCTVWDMYDSMEKSTQNEDDDQSLKSATVKESKQSDHTGSINKTKTSVATGTILSEISGLQSEHVVEAEAKQAKESQNNYQDSEEFRLNAFFMERFLNQNTYQSKQARYRGYKPVNVDEQQPKITQQYDGLSLEKLWTYTCALTKDRNVSCITWNKKNKDILATGYGKFEFNDDQSGLVCCWCLKNPEFPERFYKTEAGVTAIAFSQKNANLLAVGLFNGSIHIFDVRSSNNTSLISTSDNESKHLGPVWHLKWTDRDRANSTGEDDEMEVLMSISSDGRVTQWMIRKGFESSDYLKLKRIMTKTGTQQQKKDKAEGLISRHSGGLCFDIWDQDKSIYLCGTEEGFIHRCSTSYNEQYLDTYQGHTGPIYKLAWSPFLKNCFLSASSDWTIRLWKTNRFAPCLTFNSTTKSVYDICWSNHSATMFCCVNENAIELWDLSKSTLDPIYVTSPLAPIKLTTISYSPNSDSLIVGTNDGSLWVYAFKNLPPSTEDVDLEEIIKQSLISQLENIKVDDDETKEITEKHQLESLSAEQNKKQADDDTTIDQKEKMDAFEAKLDKIKSQTANFLENKKPIKVGSIKNLKKNNKGDGSSSSDEEN